MNALRSNALFKALTLVAIGTFLGISLVLALPRVATWSVLPDFTVYWTAGKVATSDPASVYDIVALTKAQSWAISPEHGLRPFPYPPTTLFVFIPLGLLPFWTAYWSWVAAGAITFWTGSTRLVGRRAASLAMFTPHVVLVIILGQTTLAIGSLIIWGVLLLQDRPRLAGALLGVAAALKPQSVLLAPVALISGHHWRALSTSAAAAIGLTLCSFVFGIDAWSGWVTAISAFPAVLRSYGLSALGATPRLMGESIGLSPAPLFALQFFGIIVGLPAVWCAFKSQNVRLRLCILVFGSTLASPYALRYDLATAAPVLVHGLLNTGPRGLLLATPLFGLRAITIVPALILSVVAQFAARDRRAKSIDDHDTHTREID